MDIMISIFFLCYSDAFNLKDIKQKHWENKKNSNLKKGRDESIIYC